MDSDNQVISIDEIIQEFSDTGYQGELKQVKVIQSVNCKEWEKEKQEIIKTETPGTYFHHAKIKDMATRFYVTVEKKSKKSFQHHGHFDFRPISNTISDAFLPIPKKENFFVTCRKPYRSDDFENPSIITVPYTQPDENLGCCAPACLWIMLTTMANELGSNYISLTDIIKNLPKKDGTSPVAIHEFTKILKKIKTPYYYYHGQKGMLELSPKKSRRKGKVCETTCQIMDSKILYSYIESEIPVYLVFKLDDLLKLPIYSSDTPPNGAYHSVVAIGHTMDEGGNCGDFIIHDVSRSPFITIPAEYVDEHLYEALVLLPEKTLQYDVIKKNLSDAIKIFLLNNKMLLGPSTSIEKIKIRPFLMRSQRVKFWFSNQHRYPPLVADAISNADFPHYVWMIEISSDVVKKANHSLGSIIFNGESPDNPNRNPTITMMISPEYIMYYKNEKPVEFRYKDPIFSSLPIFRLSKSTKK